MHLSLSFFFFFFSHFFYLGPLSLPNALSLRIYLSQISFSFIPFIQFFYNPSFSASHPRSIPSFSFSPCPLSLIVCFTSLSFFLYHPLSPSLFAPPFSIPHCSPNQSLSL
jgi:hypothetical protein